MAAATSTGDCATPGSHPLRLQPPASLGGQQLSYSLPNLPRGRYEVSASNGLRTLIDRFDVQEAGPLERAAILPEFPNGDCVTVSLVEVDSPRGNPISVTSAAFRYTGAALHPSPCNALPTPIGASSYDASASVDRSGLLTASVRRWPAWLGEHVSVALRLRYDADQQTILLPATGARTSDSLTIAIALPHQATWQGNCVAITILAADRSPWSGADAFIDYP